MSEQDQPEELPDNSGEQLSENNTNSSKGRRRRVRKRIRIKKKPSTKKKIKKYLERLLWLLVIVGFITTLVIWMRAMDINDDRSQAKKKKVTMINTNLNLFKDHELFIKIT